MKVLTTYQCEGCYEIYDSLEEATECLYNKDGKCVQDDIHLNAYQLCESVDMGP